jgi:hypothetical protein
MNFSTNELDRILFLSSFVFFFFFSDRQEKTSDERESNDDSVMDIYIYRMIDTFAYD